MDKYDESRVCLGNSSVPMDKQFFSTFVCIASCKDKTMFFFSKTVLRKAKSNAYVIMYPKSTPLSCILV